MQSHPCSCRGFGELRKKADGLRYNDRIATGYSTRQFLKSQSVRRLQHSSLRARQMKTTFCWACRRITPEDKAAREAPPVQENVSSRSNCSRITRWQMKLPSAWLLSKLDKWIVRQSFLSFFPLNKKWNVKENDFHSKMNSGKNWAQKMKVIHRWICFISTSAHS